MACTTCGSNVPCDCGCSSPRSGVILGNPLCVDDSSGSQCCQNVVKATPQPFYSCAPSCTESHMQKITINQFYADVKIASSWNIPGCGLQTIVNIPGLKDIVTGSYLWNATYGYFEVTAFDSATGQVTLLNHCNVGNAATGVQVPACTSFVVTDPPPPTVDTGDPCVAIDFTAPDVGDCIDITLTTTTGIAVGDTVEIGTGFYRVNEIKANEIITICNDGSGITPGTPVIALDANGNFQYCLQIIASNPCTVAGDTAGALLICDNNVQKPLSGPTSGYVAMLTNVLTNEAQYRPLDATVPLCIGLANALSIISGTATYTLVVDSSLGFAINDILIVDNYPDRFTITNIPDGTHITGTFNPVPSSNVIIPIGSLVCVIGCCEELRNEIATAVCGPQIIIGAIPLQWAVVPVNITPICSSPGICTETAFQAEVIFPLSIADVTIPSGCGNYYLFGNANVNVLLDFESPTVAVVMQECELVWSNLPPPRTGGKMVWTDYASDGDDGTMAYPPGFPTAIWDQMFVGNPTPVPNYPIMFHGGDIEAFSGAVTPSTPLSLKLFYKLTTGENSPPTVINSAYFMISGIWKLFRT